MTDTDTELVEALETAFRNALPAWMPAGHADEAVSAMRTILASPALQTHIAAKVAEEREACAALASVYKSGLCAAQAIRERGE